jgi:hypothetical protein
LNLSILRTLGSEKWRLCGSWVFLKVAYFESKNLAEMLRKLYFFVFNQRKNSGFHEYWSKLYSQIMEKAKVV